MDKRGNKYYRQELVEEPLKLIVARSKDESATEYWFITNDFELRPKEIANAYRRRWDIEVFFRFIKQELNASHLISLNKNGIEEMCIRDRGGRGKAADSPDGFQFDFRRLLY